MDQAQPAPCGTYTRKQLKTAYGISYSTLRSWLHSIGITHANRKLKPIEVRQIFTHFDPPESLNQ